MKKRRPVTQLTPLFALLLTLSTVRAQDPVIVRATQIRGAEGTGSCGEGYDLGVGLVDLDHGLGAGATTYDHNGVLWCETYAPYLWSEEDGTSTLCELQGEFNWEHSTYIPSGMTPDGSKIVGGVIFFDSGTNAPWMWTANAGPVEFLKLPAGYSGGNAVAISPDGRLIAGNLRGPGRVGVSRAAVWRDGTPEILASTQPWSAVGSNPFEANVAYTARRTHPMTSDWFGHRRGLWPSLPRRMQGYEVGEWSRAASIYRRGAGTVQRRRIRC